MFWLNISNHWYKYSYPYLIFYFSFHCLISAPAYPAEPTFRKCRDQIYSSWRRLSAFILMHHFGLCINPSGRLVAEFISGNIEAYLHFLQFSILSWHRLLKSIFMEDKDLFILHSRYHSSPVINRRRAAKSPPMNPLRRLLRQVFHIILHTAASYSIALACYWKRYWQGCHSCWWPGDSSQGINNQGIDLGLPEYSGFSTRRF